MLRRENSKMGNHTSRNEVGVFEEQKGGMFGRRWVRERVGWDHKGSWAGSCPLGLAVMQGLELCVCVVFLGIVVPLLKGFSCWRPRKKTSFQPRNLFHKSRRERKKFYSCVSIQPNGMLITGKPLRRLWKQKETFALLRSSGDTTHYSG